MHKYVCVAEKDVLVVRQNGRDYNVEVLECRPKPVALVIDTDITIHFENPKDFAEEQKKVSVEFAEDKKEDIEIRQKFPGKGVQVGKKKRLLPLPSSKIEEKLSFDPRKHRINYVMAEPRKENFVPFGGNCIEAAGKKKFKSDATELPENDIAADQL
eukprot:TRINITY_DN6965_c0_g2_i6.p1 TRINITY_DN6965_c0_g2~~TRINITY_DN6965_c0_g2_i6.p1  ORF type:complete len:157 (+),score=42.02 TRINITY_DN6965_c0_g2_i6:137-607(+)